MGYDAEILEQAVQMVVDGANFRRTGRYPTSYLSDARHSPLSH